MDIRSQWVYILCSVSYVGLHIVVVTIPEMVEQKSFHQTFVIANVTFFKMVQLKLQKKKYTLLAYEHYTNFDTRRRF